MSRIYASAIREFSRQARFGSALEGFTLIAHPGTEKWLTDTRCLAKLRAYFSDPGLVVHLYPRSMVSQILGRPAAPYAFRAFTRGDESYIFVDDVETPTSLCWIMGHELTHQLIEDSPTIKAAMADASARSSGLDPASDRFHEVDPEELFCDGIATKLVGQRLDRTWWRKRVRQFGQNI